MVGITEKIAERYIISVLKQLKCQTVSDLIKYNIPPEKVYNVDELAGNYKSIIVKLIKKHKEEILKSLNTDIIYTYLKKEREDLYQLFTTPEGRAYLNRIIDEFKNAIKNL